MTEPVMLRVDPTWPNTDINSFLTGDQPNTLKVFFAEKTFKLNKHTPIVQSIEIMPPPKVGTAASLTLTLRV